MAEQQAGTQPDEDWVNICCEEGCAEPVTAERPSARPYVFEDGMGNVVHVFAPGDVDEGVCAKHAGQEED